MRRLNACIIDMEKKKDNKLKRSLIIRWCIKYMSISLVPLIVFVCFAYYSSHLLFRNIKLLSKASLTAVSRELDAVLDSTSSISEDILLSSDVTAIRTIYPFEEKVQTQDLYAASNSIRHIMNGYSAIDDVMIFSLEDDRYISTMRWGSIEDIFLREEFSLPYNKEEFEAIFRKEASTTMVYDASYTYYTNDKMDRILVIRPLSFVQYGSREMYYLALVANIEDVFEEEYISGNDFMIVRNDTGEILYDYLGSYEDAIVPDSILSADSGESISYKGKIATIGKSVYSNFTYVILADKAEYNRYRNLMLISSFSLFFISFMLSALMVLRSAKSEWRDYESAMTAFGDDSDKAMLSSKSQYLPFIETANKMKEERALMGKVIESQTERLKEEAILKLLDTDSAPLGAEVLEECGIKFRYNSFAILLFAIAESADKAALENKLKEEIESDEMNAIPFPSKHGISFIISLKDCDEYYKEIAKRVKVLIGNIPEIERAASSDVREGLKSLGSDYLDAINVLEYESEVGLREFLIYHDINNLFKKVGFSYTTEDEIKLQTAIEKGDEIESKKLIYSYIDKNKETSSPRSLRYLLFSIMGTVIRTSNHLKMLYGWELPEINISSIIQSESFSSSLEEVLSVLEGIIKVVQEKRNESEDFKEESYLVYKKALSIIQNEFSDSMLNVSTVAEHLGVSNVYLSKIFKKYHGSNISDYIAQYRIMVSKKYLSQDKPMKEIVDICGFGSLRTFLRQFKDKENITPSQFRAMRKESADEEV